MNPTGLHALLSGLPRRGPIARSNRTVARTLTDSQHGAGPGASAQPFVEGIGQRHADTDDRSSDQLAAHDAPIFAPKSAGHCDRPRRAGVPHCQPVGLAVHRKRADDFLAPSGAAKCKVRKPSNVHHFRSENKIADEFIRHRQTRCRYLEYDLAYASGRSIVAHASAKAGEFSIEWYHIKSIRP